MVCRWWFLALATNFDVRLIRFPSNDLIWDTSFSAETGFGSYGVTYIAWSPDGLNLAIISRDVLYIIDRYSGKQLNLPGDQVNFINTLAWKHEGKTQSC